MLAARGYLVLVNMGNPVRTVAIVGAGSAGLITALMIRQLNPDLPVKVLYSARIGHIMIGEGTVATTPLMLHDRAGLDRDAFCRIVHPTPKLGTRFLWGSRGEFHYTFEIAFAGTGAPGCRLPVGYGIPADGPMTGYSLGSALMATRRVKADGDRLAPGMSTPSMAYHMENEALVSFLTLSCRERGIELVEAELSAVETGDKGVERVVAVDGRSFEADLFVDCSGFSGKLIHGALGEPYVSMRDHLACDRAVVGGWRRGDEPLQPFTTAETMDAGWCWRIEHGAIVNRGYVYSSAFIDDDAAEAEFRRKNPKVTDTRVVRFESRRARRSWVGNVVAIGNANGFVEPLEATNLQVICNFAQKIAGMLSITPRISPLQVDTFNQYTERSWNSVRDFLAVHYRFNYLKDTPFWQHAREATPLGGVEDLVAYYREAGPDPFGLDIYLPKGDLFGVDGYLAMLLGCGVPYAGQAEIDPAERTRVAFSRQVNTALAQRCSDPALLDPSNWRGSTSARTFADTGVAVQSASQFADA